MAFQTLSPAAVCAPADKAQAKKSRPPPVDEWWKHIDTGPFIADTIAVEPTGALVALKGLAISLGTEKSASVVFDSEMLGWRGGFDGTVQLEGTPWNGSPNNTHYPADDARFFFANQNDLRGVSHHRDFADPRPTPAGPLPKEIGRYRGLFRHGRQTVVHSTVAGVDVFESPGLETAHGVRAITRTVNAGATPGSPIESRASLTVPRQRKPTPSPPCRYRPTILGARRRGLAGSISFGTESASPRAPGMATSGSPTASTGIFRR